jgi:hypothetical protein
LTGEYDGETIGCFIRASRPKIATESDEVYDLAEVLHRGIKAIKDADKQNKRR